MKKMVVNDNLDKVVEFDLFSQRLYYDYQVDNEIKSTLSVEINSSGYSINDFAEWLNTPINSISFLNENDIEYERFTEYTQLESVFRSSDNTTNNFILQFI